MENKLFERGTRLNVMFNTHKGLLPISDVWHLPLTKLNDIALRLDEEIQAAGKKSFIGASQVPEKTQLKFDIILHIIKTRQEEAEEKKEAATKAEMRTRIEKRIAKKKEEAEDELTIEELEAQLKKL